jgi:hypothetical protein
VFAHPTRGCPPAQILLRVLPVRSRQTQRLVAGLRRHTISRVCALWIVALILIPFTAPFKTYELRGSSHDASSHDGLPKDKAATDEKLAGLPHASQFAPPLRIVVVSLVTRRTDGGHHQPRSTILRL